MPTARRASAHTTAAVPTAAPPMPTARAATASSYNKGDSISVSSGAAHAHGAAHAIFNYLLSC
jgi:hypothetical protein